MEESNVQVVTTPVNVCGDIHGQFYDLLNLFKEAGEIPDNNYIFMGDYVDRGYNSVETMTYLILLKVMYPGNITLIRGNHESRIISHSYGFYDEITRKYGNMICYNLFMDLFDLLPIGALIDGKIMCVHGGLSPDIKTIDQIRTIDRVQEIPTNGPFADLMWSDPDVNVDKWYASSRGAGYVFGHRVLKDFLHINDLSLLSRAHQLVDAGYEYIFDKQLVTVWSAPNYSYRMGNKACVMRVDEAHQQEFIMFTDSPQSARQAQPKKVLPYFL